MVGLQENLHKWRVLIAVWAVMESLCFFGIFYGWGSLVYVLKDEGLYEDLCSDEELSNNLTVSTTSLGQEGKETGCTAQNNRFSLIYTIASSLMLAGIFVMGKVSHYCGTRTARLVSEALYAAGFVLVAFASKDVPWLLFPGMTFIGISGISLMFSNVQISLLFFQRAGVVVGFICGASDSSPIIMLLVKLSYEAGVSRRTSMLILAGTSLCTLVSTFFFLPKTVIDVTEVHDRAPYSSLEKSIDVEENSINVQEQSKNGDLKHEISENKESPSTDKTLYQTIFSRHFLQHVAWYCVLNTRSTMFFNSINAFLEYVLDTDHEVSEYTNIFSYLLLLGIFTSPVAGSVISYSLKRFKDGDENARVLASVLPLTIASLLGMILSALMMVEVPAVFYPMFAVLVVFRSFVFTVNPAVISQAFPAAYFAALIGYEHLIAAVVNLTQYAFTKWADQNGFRQMHGFLLLVTSLTLLHPLYLWWTHRRFQENNHQSKLIEENR